MEEEQQGQVNVESEGSTGGAAGRWPCEISKIPGKAVDTEGWKLLALKSRGAVPERDQAKDTISIAVGMALASESCASSCRRGHALDVQRGGAEAAGRPPRRGPRRGPRGFLERLLGSAVFPGPFFRWRSRSRRSPTS